MTQTGPVLSNVLISGLRQILDHQQNRRNAHHRNLRASPSRRAAMPSADSVATPNISSLITPYIAAISVLSSVVLLLCSYAIYLYISRRRLLERQCRPDEKSEEYAHGDRRMLPALVFSDSGIGWTPTPSPLAQSQTKRSTYKAPHKPVRAKLRSVHSLPEREKSLFPLPSMRTRDSTSTGPLQGVVHADALPSPLRYVHGEQLTSINEEDEEDRRSASSATTQIQFSSRTPTSTALVSSSGGLVSADIRLLLILAKSEEVQRTICDSTVLVYSSAPASAAEQVRPRNDGFEENAFIDSLSQLDENLSLMEKLVSTSSVRRAVV